jgi:DNA modification methylase
MRLMPEQSVDFSVFSPPFPSLFAYTSSPADIGNSNNLGDEAKLHLGFFFRGLSRVMKPGRIVVVHCSQIPALKRNDCTRGQYDFRGMLIRIARRSGFDYDGDILVTKSPQAQAIRTHSHRLQFASLGRDRTCIVPAMCDYLIKLIAPGENDNDVNSSEITRDEWIRWAEGAWTDIRETDTLNFRLAKGENDTKHICPLQLEPIRRLIKMYTNPGELVFSPFAGVGSEGFIALKLGRRFYGCELKDEYYAAASKNLAECCVEDDQPDLFSPTPVGHAITTEA